MYLAEAICIIILAIFRIQIPGERKLGAAELLVCKASVSTPFFQPFKGEEPKATVSHSSASKVLCSLFISLGAPENSTLANAVYCPFIGAGG